MFCCTARRGSRGPSAKSWGSSPVSSMWHVLLSHLSSSLFAPPQSKAPGFGTLCATRAFKWSILVEG